MPLLPRPGVDVAVHTYEPLLATAAWLDTAQHLRALMAAGQTVAAWRIYASVVEIRHAPAGPVLSSTIPGLPPFRRVPCVAADCARCCEGRGGFQFPFVGLWTRRGVFPPPDANGAEAWERLARWPATETCDLLSLEAIRSGISVLEICPTHVEATSASTSCLPLGASGSWAIEYGETHTWDRCLAGKLPCLMPELGDAERFGVGWEPGRAVKPSITAVSHVVIQPHFSVLVASGFSAVNAHARAKILALQLVVILTAAAMADPPRGRYALEATEGSEPSWSAATAIDLAQEVFVGEFRQSRNLMKDSDFAFAFSSYEEAQAVGGQFVATAWAQVRANEMEHLIPDVASTVEASSSSAAPPRRRPAPQLRRAHGLRLQPKKDTPENVMRRVDALQRVFIQMGAFRPTGDLSEVLQRDWKQTVRRLAQDRVTQAETTTVLNAIRTWQELLIFLRSRNRSPPPSFVDFDTFLRDGTLAPARALQSLKWLTNQGKTQWELAGLQVPKHSSERKKAKTQATVIEPPMVPFLEEKVQAMYESGNALWTAALDPGSWGPVCSGINTW